MIWKANYSIVTGIGNKSRAPVGSRTKLPIYDYSVELDGCVCIGGGCGGVNIPSLNGLGRNVEIPRRPRETHESSIGLYCMRANNKAKMKHFSIKLMQYST